MNRSLITRHDPRRWLLLFLLVGTLVLSASDSREYDLKSAIIFNLTRFVQWPSEAFRTPDSPFVIGIFGRDPFRKSLDAVVENESVNGHRIVVRRYSDPSELQNCHLVFIASSEDGRIDSVVSQLKGRPILVVTDNDEGYGYGEAINLKTERNRVKMRIDPEAAKIAGLEVSSKLMRLAEIASR